MNHDRDIFVRFAGGLVHAPTPRNPLSPRAPVQCGTRGVMTVAVVLLELWGRVTQGLGTHLSVYEIMGYFGVSQSSAHTIFWSINTGGKNISYTEFEAFVLRKATVSDIETLGDDLWPARPGTPTPHRPVSPPADTPTPPSTVAHEQHEAEQGDPPNRSICERLFRLLRRLF